MIFEALDDRLWLHPDLTNICPESKGRLWTIRVNRKHAGLYMQSIAYMDANATAPSAGPMGRRTGHSAADLLAMTEVLAREKPESTRTYHARALSRAGVAPMDKNARRTRTPIDTSLVLFNPATQSCKTVAHFVDVGINRVPPVWLRTSNGELFDRYKSESGISEAALGEFARQCSATRSARRLISNRVRWINNRVPMVRDGRLYVPTETPFKREWGEGYAHTLLKVASRHPEGVYPLAMAPPDVMGRIIRAHVAEMI